MPKLDVNANLAFWNDPNNYPTRGRWEPSADYHVTNGSTPESYGGIIVEFKEYGVGTCIEIIGTCPDDAEDQDYVGERSTIWSMEVFTPISPFKLVENRTIKDLLCDQKDGTESSSPAKELADLTLSSGYYLSA